MKTTEQSPGRIEPMVILPCPFCGKKPTMTPTGLVREYGYALRCVNLQCRMNVSTMTFRYEKHAVNAWNKRAK
jgi:Lar family restriction alleviation protein